MTETVTTNLTTPEKLLPSSLTVLIADDMLGEAAATADAVREVNPDYKIIAAHSAKNLLDSALHGKDGKQPDLTLLDENFIMDADKWKLTAKMLAEYNEDLPWSSLSEDILESCHGSTFAAILRAVGYTGKIVSVTNSPPEPSDFAYIARDFRQIGISVEDLPISGYVLKGGQFYSLMPDTVDPELWEISPRLPDRSFAGTLRHVIREIIPSQS